MTNLTTSYRLRAGAPQPAKGRCTSLGEVPPLTTFVLQTFMAEKTETTNCQDKTQLLSSLDMQGLGGEYISASYQSQKFKDVNGDLLFNATETKVPTIIEEDQVPGALNL